MKNLAFWVSLFFLAVAGLYATILPGHIGTIVIYSALAIYNYLTYIKSDINEKLKP